MAAISAADKKRRTGAFRREGSDYTEDENRGLSLSLSKESDSYLSSIQSVQIYK